MPNDDGTTPQRRSSALLPVEGRLLSRKHVEASRRAAKEALEEDMRALDLVVASSGTSSTTAAATEHQEGDATVAGGGGKVDAVDDYVRE